MISMGSDLRQPGHSNIPIKPGEGRLLSQIEFQRLAKVPAEAEWFANLTNENTKRAYRKDVTSFIRYAGIKTPEEFRLVKRSHVIAWRKLLENQKLSAATVRRKLSALSDLFNYLCEKNAVPGNPSTTFIFPQ